MLHVLFSFLFHNIIIYGYVPTHFKDSIITPLLKNRKDDITDKDNYRPIAITCISSQVIILLVLHRCKECFITTDNQFSFKAKHSTDMCTFLMKETIDY